MNRLIIRLALALTMTALAATAVLAAPQAPVEIRATSPQGNTMAGEVLLPEGPGPHPVVLLISGTGRQSRDFESFKGQYRPHRDIANALLAKGIGVVRFDERNTGASTGDHRTARSADLKNDVSSILDAARKVPGVGKVFIFGHSEGAIFAQQLAVERGDIAGIVVAGAPAKSGREMMRDQVPLETPRTSGMSDADHAEAVRVAYDKEIAFQMTRPSLGDLLDYDFPALARRIKVPALVLEGAEDWQVKPPQGEAVAKAMREGGDQDVTYRKLPEVGHLLVYNPSGVTDYDKLTDFTIAPAVLTATTTWVAAHR